MPVKRFAFSLSGTKKRQLPRTLDAIQYNLKNYLKVYLQNANFIINLIIMDKLYSIAKGLKKRFPEGEEPYQMATRLLEECGEVAAEINHWEDSGVKRLKRGEPSKEYLANELKHAIVALLRIAIYYKIEDELEESINHSIIQLKNEGLLD